MEAYIYFLFVTISSDGDNKFKYGNFRENQWQNKFTGMEENLHRELNSNYFTIKLLCESKHNNYTK